MSPWKGWGWHGAVGFGLAWLLSWLGTPPAGYLVAVTALGIAHELGDGDFLPARKGPLNGTLDAAWFLVGAMLWFVWSAIR